MSDSTYETIRVERDESAATVTLARPDHLNSLTRELTEELRDAVTELTADDGVRCIVLAGAGDAFGAGADLARLDGDAGDEPVIRQLASTLHETIRRLHRAEKPVVVGVDGVAAGAGFSLALSGDVVLASDEARFEYAYPRVGLTGDGGSTFLLPRLVGLRRAKEIALLDEPIDPERAVDLGIATEVVADDEFDDRLDELASRLAEGPTKALGRVKRLMTEGFDRRLEDQLAAETNAIAESTRTEDYARGHDAFYGDDDPEFVGR
ncbi:MULTISPECIES: enoyl-CoA hydratase/isomerase family protein [Halorussus]|uniref:enoyl-CoA hydratase/isomerase family protein n=1 Tax=Halorussus TaxID=1070314 RepID=UPI000E216F1F|nr:MULTISPECIES: enoyl-CoA hydratase-related protein [Halorussus]NHN60859.1 enoyl-CoA hydratase/isomerase family protein [Halorussus sp. JP-T4]